MAKPFKVLEAKIFMSFAEADEYKKNFTKPRVKGRKVRVREKGVTGDGIKIPVWLFTLTQELTENEIQAKKS